MPILPAAGHTPKVDPSVYLAPSAYVIGDVEIGEQSSVWFGTVIRGDVHRIRIGRRTNIQDLSMVHVFEGKFPTTLEDDVTVGHNVVLHGCHIKSRVLVGIGAIVLDGVVVESNTVIAAGSLIPPGMHVPSGVLMMGQPAKPKRDLKPEELDWILKSAQAYVKDQTLY